MARQPISPRNAAPPANHNLTPAMEDYLRAIYLVGESGDVTTHALAAQLGVAPPSVTEMMRRLAEHGLIEYTPYQHISLTTSGEGIASDLAERYRLVASYLVSELGYADDAVDQEADRIEHAVSSRLRACLARHVGRESDHSPA